MDFDANWPTYLFIKVGANLGMLPGHDWAVKVGIFGGGSEFRFPLTTATDCGDRVIAGECESAVERVLVDIVQVLEEDNH